MVIKFLLFATVPTLPSLFIYVQPEITRRFLSLLVGIILSIQSDTVVAACECVRCFVLIPVDLGVNTRFPILTWVVHLVNLLLDLSQP